MRDSKNFSNMPWKKITVFTWIDQFPCGWREWQKTSYFNIERYIPCIVWPKLHQHQLPKPIKIHKNSLFTEKKPTKKTPNQTQQQAKACIYCLFQIALNIREQSPSIANVSFLHCPSPISPQFSSLFITTLSELLVKCLFFLSAYRKCLSSCQAETILI